MRVFSWLVVGTLVVMVLLAFGTAVGSCIHECVAAHDNTQGQCDGNTYDH